MGDSKITKPCSYGDTFYAGIGFFLRAEAEKEAKECAASLPGAKVRPVVHNVGAQDGIWIPEVWYKVVKGIKN